jgi:nucleoside-diphosphate-sugar epimerase
MTIALTGANSDLARYLIPKLRDKYEVLSYSRRNPDQYFDFLLADKVDFQDANFIFHFAHPYTINPDYFENILNNLDLMLVNAKQSGINHVLISSLSSFPGNSSNYSYSKFCLEELFRSRGHGVVRIGLVTGGEQEGFQAFARIRRLLRFFPFRFSNNENISFFLTDVRDLLSRMEAIISSSNMNFSEDLFTIGPLNFEDFSAEILGSPRKCLFLNLDIEIVKKFLNPFSKRLIVVDKILNFLNGMSLRT